MNYSTDVKFSNDLVKNGKTTITYSGSLFRTGAESVTLVYGFGDNWDYTTEKEMVKNENNFSVEIDLLGYDKINFCFRDSNNIWDNNNYLNYIAPISEPEQEYNFIINENLIEGIIDNVLEPNLATYETSKAINQEAQTFDIEETQEQTSNIELVENSVISEEDFVIDIPDETPADIQEFIGETKEEPALTNDLETAFNALFEDSKDDKKENIVNFDMDSIVDEILSPIAKPKQEIENYEVKLDLNEIEFDNNIESAFSQEVSIEENAISENVQEIENASETVVEGIQEADATMENIQEAVANETSAKEENVQESILGEDSEDSLLQDINEETSLIEVKEEKNSFLVSPRSLSKFYILKKKIKLAVYKFFTAIPKIIESSFGEEKIN